MRKTERFFLTALGYFSLLLGIIYNIMGMTGQIKKNDIALSFSQSMGSVAVMSLVFFGLGFALLFLKRRLNGQKPISSWVYVAVLTWPAALLFFKADLIGRIITAVIYLAVTVFLLFILPRYAQKDTSAQPKTKAAAKPETTVKKEFSFSVLAEKIKDIELKKDVREIEKIIQEIYQNKEMRKIDPQQIKKIENYYAPTLTTLLNTYVNLEASRLGLANEEKLKKDIHEGIAAIKQGFYQICENTYQTTSMSISAELSALENVLASDGLLVDDIRKFCEEKNGEELSSQVKAETGNKTE